MSSNPNNAVGTNGAYGGRTSVNAFNDVMAALSRGVISGWECVPDSGMTVSLGGNGTTRDSAIAEDNAGNRTSINNISGSPINVTLDSAPGANSRIDVIVAYVDNPPTGTSTIADNPDACGIIAVTGTAASTPVVPNDSAIRTAITADGASGTTAYYVILAQVTVESGTTDIVAGDISAGDVAKLTGNGVVSSQNIDFTTFGVAVPDYANVQDFNTTTYTAPSDGFIRLRCDINTGGNKGIALMSVGLTRNGVTYSNIISEGAYFDVAAYNHAYIDKTFPVKAGDTIDIGYLGDSADWTSRDFYPVLW